MSVAIIRGDARSLPLPDASVDLIVTSPPYFGLRSYTDNGEHYEGQIGSEATPAEFLAALVACTREWVRVLKPSGSLFVNLGDKYSTGNSGDRNTDLNERWGNAPGKRAQERSQQRTGRVQGMPTKSLLGIPWRYAIACMDDFGLILRAEIVWAKPNGLPESVTDRVRRAHEQVFHFTAQPRYYAAVDEIREPASGYHRPASADRGDRGGLKARAMLDTCNPLGKLPGSVWEIPSAPLTVPASLGVDHFAAFPPALVRPVVKAWSPPGGTVLDPFGGTGTTALVASVHGRRGISVDMSADYCRLAAWRTSDPGERARALNVPKPPPVPGGMEPLFELGESAVR